MGIRTLTESKTAKENFCKERFDEQEARFKHLFFFRKEEGYKNCREVLSEIGSTPGDRAEAKKITSKGRCSRSIQQRN